MTYSGIRTKCLGRFERLVRSTISLIKDMFEIVRIIDMNLIRVDSDDGTFELYEKMVYLSWVGTHRNARVTLSS